MEKKELSKRLTTALKCSSFETVNYMIDVIVPTGYIVVTSYDKVEVFDNIEDLELNEDDLVSLRESYRGIDIDDANIQIVN